MKPTMPQPEAQMRVPRRDVVPWWILSALLLAMTVMAFSCATLGFGTSFKPRGEASYYGPGFHGRTTANGEVFDKDALTAAHKTLPFGTRLRVTNRENGRSVVVRINDRFPGTRGRVIDLSEGAFRHIAPLEQGVIPVELEIISGGPAR